MNSKLLGLVAAGCLLSACETMDAVEQASVPPPSSPAPRVETDLLGTNGWRE